MALADATTALWPYGGPGSPYGDFSGKSQNPPTFSGTIPDISETENTGLHQYDLSTYFSGATSYSIDPAVEAGWDFDTVTGILEIDTDAIGVFGSYVITGTNLAGSDDSNGFTVTVVAVPDTQTPAGKKRKRRKRYTVVVDGQEFEVSSVAEAERLLQKAKALAEEAAPVEVKRQVKRANRRKRVVALSLPTISSPNPELESLVSEYREDIEAIYRRIAEDAETRELLRLKLLEDDEEEAIFVLLH